MDYLLFMMRKRISKQKDIKIEQVQSKLAISKTAVNQPNPIYTKTLLLRKTECLQQTLKFEKERIDKIVSGTSIESIKFQQIEKNCSFQQFLKRYYHFHHIKYLFTELIHRNALAKNITFMDFKLKNFIIMNNYAYQLKRINFCKDSNDLTASRSSTKEGRHFKELEIEVKKITKKNAGSSRRKGNNNNGSASFTNLLIRNIQKMLKNYKEINTNPPLSFKPILTSKNMQSNQSQASQERLHTSPQPMAFDAYGLEQFKDKNIRKFQRIAQMSQINQRLKTSQLNTQKSQDTMRYQTEYDTQKINTKRSKSKKNQLLSKKSSNKVKENSKGKTCSLIKAIQNTKK